jgi:hypothetical protein
MLEVGSEWCDSECMVYGMVYGVRCVVKERQRPERAGD